MQGSRTTSALVVGIGPAWTDGEYTIELAYRIGVMDYRGRQQVHGDRPSGRTVLITYDPANPQRFLLVGQEVSRRIAKHLVLGGIVAMLVGALLVVDSLQRLRGSIQVPD